MILVTGGAGFIGSNIVAALCERGAAVTVCDRLRESDKWRNLAKHDVADIISPDGLDHWIGRQGRRIDAVVHMGAISSTTARDADLVFDVNVRLSTALWDWCAQEGTPLIYASSAATYGSGERGFDDDGSPEALANLRPLNAYGWSKHVFDRRIAGRLARGETAPPQWVGLKFFNVYGPNEYHKGPMQSVVAQKHPLVTSGKRITLFASHRPDFPDGGQLRDFVYVRDCVAVVLWLLDHPNVSGLFNLGTGEARSFEDLARALSDAVGVAAQIDYVPMPESIRANYQYFTRASIGKLRAAGYAAPFTRLEDGVRDYVTSYLSTADRYR